MTDMKLEFMKRNKLYDKTPITQDEYDLLSPEELKYTVTTPKYMQQNYGLEYFLIKPHDISHDEIVEMCHMIQAAKSEESESHLRVIKGISIFLLILIIFLTLFILSNY